MKSPVYVRCFWFILINYIVFVELYFRLSPVQQGSISIIWEWLQYGNARIMLTVIWTITTIAFISLAADHLRNLYIIITGTPDTYIFLGDRLREGIYVVREYDMESEPIFVEYFVVRNQYPAASFHLIYDRKILIRDTEGNLTTAEMFKTGRLILFSFIQLALLLFSAMCVITVADQYLSGFPGADSIQDLSRAITLPVEFKVSLLLFLVMLYVICLMWMIINNGKIRNVSGKALELPSLIREGAQLSGKVIASEDYEIDNSQRTVNEARFYRRYVFCFDGREFPLPIYINWTRQRIHEGNISVARGRLKQERKQDKEYYDRVFEYLDNAIEAGSEVKVELGEELDINPLLP